MNGKHKSYTIGDFTQISLTEARKIREELKDKLDGGKTIQLSAQNTFESVFRDWWKRWSQTVSKGMRTGRLFAWKVTCFQ